MSIATSLKSASVDEGGVDTRGFGGGFHRLPHGRRGVDTFAAQRVRVQGGGGARAGQGGDPREHGLVGRRALEYQCFGHGLGE
jgi:hypothetical protein